MIRLPQLARAYSVPMESERVSRLLFGRIFATQTGSHFAGKCSNAGWIKQNRHSSLRADRRPAFGYVIDIDQLLLAPRPDDYDDNDVTAIRALGIPVIPGVPPIFIVTPPQREKHPSEAAAARRRAR